MVCYECIPRFSDSWASERFIALISTYTHMYSWIDIHMYVWLTMTLARIILCEHLVGILFMQLFGFPRRSIIQTSCLLMMSCMLTWKAMKTFKNLNLNSFSGRKNIYIQNLSTYHARYISWSYFPRLGGILLFKVNSIVCWCSSFKMQIVTNHK